MTPRNRAALCALLALAAPPLPAFEGELDSTFNGTGRQTIAFKDPAFATSVALAPDDRLYLVGGVGGDGTGAIGIARLLPDGEPDSTFDNDGSIIHDLYPGESTPTAASVQPDGKLVLAGLADIDGSPAVEYRMIVCRILETGTPDEAFGDGNTAGCATLDANLPDTDQAAATALHVQADGRIAVAGFVSVDGIARPVVARLLTDGSMDAAFGTGGLKILDPGAPNPVVLAGIAQDAAGDLIVAGTIQLGADDSDFAVFRVKPDGAQDMDFNEGLLTIAFDIGFPEAKRDEANAIAILPDGSIVVAGSAEHGPGQRQFAIAKLDADGVLDSSFNGTGRLSPIFCDVCVDAEAAALVVQSTGSLVLAGPVEANGASDFGVLRVQPDGTIDTGFGAQGRTLVAFDLDPADPDDVAMAAIAQNGRIVVAGSVAAPDNHTVFGVARLQSDLIYKNGFELPVP